MCRSIRPLFNLRPQATPEELRLAARQFVRKISGFREPSQKNRALFEQAVEDVAAVAGRLMRGLVTASPPRARAEGSHRHPAPGAAIPADP